MSTQSFSTNCKHHYEIISQENEKFCSIYNVRIAMSRIEEGVRRNLLACLYHQFAHGSCCQCFDEVGLSRQRN